LDFWFEYKPSGNPGPDPSLNCGLWLLPNTNLNLTYLVNFSSPKSPKKTKTEKAQDRKAQDRKAQDRKSQA
jgi:hypothetical protein